MKVCQGALIFFLGLSSFAASVVAPTKAEVEAMYSVAAHELNAGHLREALQQLDAIDARQPDLAAAHNLRGVALMRLSDYGNAEVALRKAREIDPTFWEARFNLAEVAFLQKRWPEARRRFEALLEKPGDEVQGSSGDLIQFKILLTYLLQGKEELAAPILAKFKAAPATPAYRYAKAAFALRQKDRTGAMVSIAAAKKEFSPPQNKLFAESFYEIGWLEKPEAATPIALEVTSLADRAAQARTAFEKAETAYRNGDFEGALHWLDEVEKATPNEPAANNLRGKILLEEGAADAAESALRAALAANPQLEDARYNLARVALQRKDYEGARKQLETLLGATAGGRAQREREQLVRYQIFLTLLLEGRDAPAQKAMDGFQMMDDTPALYYAQAAWAFQHGNAKQASNWIANARNLFAPERNRSFAAPLADLGWLKSAGLRPAAAQVALAEATPTPVPPPSPPSREEAVPAIAKSDSSPPPIEPTPSAKEKKIADKTEKRSRKREATSSTRKRRPAQAESTPAPSATPASPVVESTPRPNLGDKIARFFLYPFKRRPNESARPVSSATATPGKQDSPTTPKPSRSKN